MLGPRKKPRTSRQVSRQRRKTGRGACRREAETWEAARRDAGQSLGDTGGGRGSEKGCWTDTG